MLIIEVMSQKELDEKYSIPEAVNYKVLPKKHIPWRIQSYYLRLKSYISIVMYH